MATTRTTKLDELTPDHANANKGTERGRYALEASLRKYGAGRSILIDKHGRIIAGNKTAETAADVGIDDVIVVQTDGRQVVAVQRTDLDLDSNEARELAYADNRVGQLDLDFDPAQILADLNAGVNLDQFWRKDELDELLADLQPKTTGDTPAETDRAEELRQKWGTAAGQLWQLGEHRLICGDCTDAATVARVMGGERAALAWFDPPFGIDLVPQRGLTERIENDGNQQARALWAAFLPLLKEYMSPDTNLFLCQDWTEFEWTLPLVRQYFTVKSKVVWNKNVWGIGYYTRPKHEDILYCWNGQPDKPVDPVADVWDVARKSAPDHAAEKPPELSGVAITHFSKRGDVVVDWFNGVGGSVIACENLGRRCRAIELDAGFVATTLERWAQHTGKTPVLV